MPARCSWWLRAGLQNCGTGALVPRYVETAEIVRMSVAGEMRRLGLGSLILQELCAQAKKLGFRRIVLETTETWHTVIAFYQRSGFEITHYKDGDVYFELVLSDGKDSPAVPE